MFEECERLKDESNALLVAGALEIARLRENVTLRTGYTISAGIARNKLLAKLVSGKHKPDKQGQLCFTEVPATILISLSREVGSRQLCFVIA